MKRIEHRSIRLLTTFFVVSALVMLASASALASGDAGHKERCKGGGWETFLRSDGQGFQNQGDCVSYANAEGEFSRLQITTGPMIDFGGGTLGYQVSVNGEGLLPGSIVGLWLNGPGAPGGGPYQTQNVGIVQADGTISAIEFFNLSCPFPEFGFGFSSGFVTGTSSLGIAVTSPVFTAPC